MRKRLLPLCFGLLASLPAAALAAHPDAADIKALLHKHKIPETSLALVALPLDGRQAATRHNANMPVNPASVMKLVTTYAALDLLGPTFSWKTELLTDGHINGKTLQGNLYFRSGGDPKLTTERLWLLLRDLRLQGIEQVNGNLVLDGSYYDIKHLKAFNGEATDLHRPFMVEPSGLLVNFNAQRFMVKASQGRARVVSDPLVPEVHIDNQVRVVSGKSCNQSQIFYEPSTADGQLSFRVSGTLPEGCQSERYFAFVDHARFTSGVIRSTWADMGGSLSGKAIQGKAPAKARVLASLPSVSVAETIRDINKFSNNTIAKQLFLTIGRRHRAAGDADDVMAAKRVIGNWWRGLGIQHSTLVIENGSGLSRTESLTAEELALMLKHAARGPYAAEFMASIPLVGVDGTMRNRLRSHPVAGKARVKTGTLRNVRAIAGYSKDKHGNDWAVVAILNNAANQNNAVLDSLLGSLYSQQPLR